MSNLSAKFTAKNTQVNTVCFDKVIHIKLWKTFMQCQFSLTQLSELAKNVLLKNSSENNATLKNTVNSTTSCGARLSFSALFIANQLA